MIPKVSTPLTKAIRTTEGVLLAAVAVVTWVVSLVDPSTLPHSVAVHWSAYSAIALAVSRTIIKAVSAAKSGGLDPTPIDLEALAEKVAAKVGIDKLPSTADVKAAVAAAIHEASDPSSILGLPSDGQEIASPPPVETPPVAVGA